MFLRERRSFFFQRKNGSGKHESPRGNAVQVVVRRRTPRVFRLPNERFFLVQYRFFGQFFRRYEELISLCRNDVGVRRNGVRLL